MSLPRAPVGGCAFLLPATLFAGRSPAANAPAA